MGVRQLLLTGMIALGAIPMAAVSALAAAQPLPLAPETTPSRTYRVFVDGQETPVGVEQSAARPMESAAYAGEGRVEIRIVVNRPFDSCRIRPLRFGLSEQAAISTGPGDQREIRFSLDAPRRLLVEIDELPHLALIGSRRDDDLPDPQGAGVIYFGPGVHRPGRIRVQSNQTVFLDAGAKVYGTIEGTCVENVRITGRGHLYGTKHTSWDNRTYGMVFDRSRHITVENIGIRDCHWWVTKFLLCDDVAIRDVSLISFNRNNGGLMIDGCRNLSARDCLLMCRDDCICPHALNAAGNGEVVSENMLFENCVLYNYYDGNAIRIGASFETSEVRNWRFRDVDVVARAGAAIYADHSDWAVVRNLVFENFIDEASHGNSIDMRIDKTAYSCQTGYRDERGSFDGLYFLNVQSAGGPFVLKGFDREHGFDNVVFAGCQVGDRPVERLADVKTNEFVRGLRFFENADEVSASALAAPSGKETARGGLRVTSPQTLVLDDGDNGFRAYGFAPAKATQDAHGGDAQVGQVIDQFGQYAAAIYEPRIEGRYEVYAYWGAHAGLDEKASWIVRHRDGYARAYLDQNDGPGWRRLGEFDLAADSNVRLVFPNYFEPTSRPVVADAVKFVRIDSQAGK